ncbi:3-oxoacyl-[acyl-carrier-protein] synthase III C-terminal domain-containing protein [Campylobacter lari]|uniref:3-oxoacyl-[acyl-carrier-protein] synthase III C-terminal domain-containing protein n=1 Tax=Campylobacter lari TaxID=201 RepID=UPI0012830E54|nr:hypothetical protein [Campylobacter lari]EGK8039117.1 hypothetical protein [Campylobacter lari]
MQRNHHTKTYNGFFTRRTNRSSNIDHFIFHQGSKYIVDTIRQRLKLDKNKALFGANFYGNTISSSIPILLENEFRKQCYNTIINFRI